MKFYNEFGQLFDNNYQLIADGDDVSLVDADGEELLAVTIIERNGEEFGFDFTGTEEGVEESGRFEALSDDSGEVIGFNFIGVEESVVTSDSFITLSDDSDEVTGFEFTGLDEGVVSQGRLEALSDDSGEVTSFEFTGSNLGFDTASRVEAVVNNDDEITGFEFTDSVDERFVDIFEVLFGESASLTTNDEGQITEVQFEASSFEEIVSDIAVNVFEDSLEFATDEVDDSEPIVTVPEPDVNPESDTNFDESNLGLTIYRFFNPDVGIHFYTADEAEKSFVENELTDYVFEGDSYVTVDPLTGGAEEVYRFFNVDTRVHLYTTSEAERDSIQENQPEFSFEGAVFYAFETNVESSIPIYRFFDSNLGVHFYTHSEEERTFVTENLPNYELEGIAYYAYPSQ